MLYKNRYMIGVYTLNDELIALVDNVKEFSEFFKIDYKVASVIVSKFFNHNQEYFVYRGKFVTLYFIEDTEDDENY